MHPERMPMTPYPARERIAGTTTIIAAGPLACEASGGLRSRRSACPAGRAAAAGALPAPTPDRRRRDRGTPKLAALALAGFAWCVLRLHGR